MAADSSSSKMSSQGGDEPKPKGKTNQAVIDQLQAPRKKRKSFVVLAAGPNVDQDTVQAIQRFMRTQFSKLSFLTVKSAADLVKYSSRNIILAIVDDEISERTETLAMIKKLKMAKTDGPMPTLFLTNNAGALISEYQKNLQPWHEVDEYITIADAPRHALFTKIKAGLDNRHQRRSRRYKTDFPVFFQVLDTGETKYAGAVKEFSIHGALLSVDNSAHHFSTKDQILVHLPISRFTKSSTDVVRISAKVRRVLISGDQAGISWEHVSDEKSTLLTQILTSIVDVTLAKTAAATRARIAKATADADMTRTGPKPPE